MFARFRYDLGKCPVSALLPTGGWVDSEDVTVNVEEKKRTRQKEKSLSVICMKKYRVLAGARSRFLEEFCVLSSVKPCKPPQEKNRKSS
jgi:hypothetical protein